MEALGQLQAAIVEFIFEVKIHAILFIVHP